MIRLTNRKNGYTEELSDAKAKKALSLYPNTFFVEKIKKPSKKAQDIIKKTEQDATEEE